MILEIYLIMTNSGGHALWGFSWVFFKYRLGLFRNQTKRWIKNFCSVHDIDVESQIEFMLNTWGELFIIGLSQTCSKDDLTSIFATLRFVLIHFWVHRILINSFRKQMMKNGIDDELQSDLELVQKTVSYIQELELGHVEYAIARCVLFLNPLIGSQSGPNEKIEKLQSEMISKLGDLLSLQRKEKVLLRISLSKQIHKKSLEVIHNQLLAGTNYLFFQKIFFSCLIGTISINSIIPFLIKSPVDR